MRLFTVFINPISLTIHLLLCRNNPVLGGGRCSNSVRVSGIIEQMSLTPFPKYYISEFRDLFGLKISEEGLWSRIGVKYNVRGCQAGFSPTMLSVCEHSVVPAVLPRG